MARLVKSTVSSEIFCNIETTFEDDTKDIRQIKAGDVLDNPGIRYVYKGDVVEAKGRVTSISTNMVAKPTKIDLKNPVDNFTKDVWVFTIDMDCSEQYKSKILHIDAKEVVESEGVQNVKCVHCIPVPKVTMIMEYTDGSVVHQEIEVGDVLEYVKILTKPGKPPIEDSFKIMALGYVKSGNTPKFESVVLKSTTKPGDAINVRFENILSFEEVPAVEVTDPNSLSSIALALAESPSGKVAASLDVDVTIPKRDDGRITTLMINQGQELDLDLNGHSIDCQAYAFYVNGGELNIYDSGKKTGKIKAHIANKTYPVVYVLSDGVCNMEGGIIDSTEVDPEEGSNWLYGVVCYGNGVFNMHAGKIITGAASGISITNGTASGEGAQFIIGGDSYIEAVNCAGVYLADNKKVVIKDNAVVKSGIVVRLGDIIVQDNGTVYSIDDPSKVYNMGKLACESGVDVPKAAILALTGCYNSALGNDCNIIVKDEGKVIGLIDDAIDIAEVNTKYDQVMNIDIEKSKNVRFAPGTKSWRIYSNSELAVMAQEAGKTLGPETNTTTLTINMDGEQVYPEVVTPDEEG